jgi:hypothetical protein
MSVELFRVKIQQVTGNRLQGFQFLLADIGSFVLLETEDEEPSVALIRCYQCARTSAFTPAG